jgi:hypothetical protein
MKTQTEKNNTQKLQRSTTTSKKIEINPRQKGKKIVAEL